MARPGGGGFGSVLLRETALSRMSRRGPVSKGALVLVVAGWLGGCAAHRSARAPVFDQVGEEFVFIRHRIEPGQTLYRIAKAYGLTVDELMSVNEISDPTTLAVGGELIIPGATSPKSVEHKDSPEPVATPATPARQMSTAPVGKLGGQLAWPLRGVLYARFGKKGRDAHDGIDLAAPAGTGVRVAAPGHVLYAGEQRGYGMIVIVEHPGGLVTLYAHNRDVKAKTGQRLRGDEVIATVGDSGATSGPHLHFEVRVNGVPVDPLEHLQPLNSPAGKR